MKEALILWLSAIVIVFLTSYFKIVFSENYPISGTFGVDGKKVTYKMDKYVYGDSYKLIIRTDEPELEGFIYFKEKDSLYFTQKKLSYDKGVLFYDIQKEAAENIIYYYCELKKGEKIYRIPVSDYVQFTFYGKIPAAINILFNLLLYGGIILAVRTGLEHFKDKARIKKLAILTCIFFLTLLLLTNPLYLSYKFGYINKAIPEIVKLFSLNITLLISLWILGTVLIFITKKEKPTSLIIGVLSLIIYLIF